MLTNVLLAIDLQDSSGSGGGFLCLGVIVIIIIALVVSSNNKSKALAAANAAYRLSLQRLKSNPTDADLRQRTLQLGRTYSNLTRNRRGVTVFDEVALMNDISAACAGATSGSPANPIVPMPSSSIEERLVTLSDLRSKDLIDEQEYNLRRQKIIDEV
jgi:hypothetical protein